MHTSHHGRPAGDHSHFNTRFRMAEIVYTNKTRIGGHRDHYFNTGQHSGHSAGITCTNTTQIGGHRDQHFSTDQHSGLSRNQDFSPDKMRHHFHHAWHSAAA